MRLLRMEAIPKCNRLNPGVLLLLFLVGITGFGDIAGAGPLRTAPSGSSFAGAVQTAVKPNPLPRNLQTLLKSRDPILRRNAANEVGALRARTAVHPLMDLLFDGDAGVREAAAFALGQIADPLATRSLVYVLADKDAHVRASTAFALGMIEDTSVAEELSKAMDDPDVEVRASAVFALGLMHDDAAVDEIIDALNDPSFDVRYDAVWALGQIGERDAVEHLREALLNPDLAQIPDSAKEAFREAVQNALNNIGAQGDAGSGEPAPPARPRRASDSHTDKPPDHASRFPAVRQSIMPALTHAALSASANGPVSLKVMVAADGRAARAYVTHRGGYGLDRRAVEAVLQYKFDPGLRDGLPQSEWMDLELQFPAK